MSTAPSEFGLLSGLTTGGIGGSIIAALIVLYKICAKRRCKSHSGCMDVEISEAASTPAPPPTPMAPARTPVPSAQRRVSVLVLDNPEAIKKESE
jgi:hypothetical protein